MIGLSFCRRTTTMMMTTMISYRWGPYGYAEFSDNLDKFLLDLPSSSSIFWLTTAPISEETSAKGMSIPGLEQQHFLTRFHILEVNKVKLRYFIFKSSKICRKVSALKFREHGLQVIDLYMSLQSLISKRKDDGIHWTPEANRCEFYFVSSFLTIILFFQADD